MFITSSKIKVLLAQEDSYLFSEAGKSIWTHHFTDKEPKVSYVMYSLEYNLDNDKALLPPLYLDNKITAVFEKLYYFLF